MILNCLEFDPKKRCSALMLIRYFKPDFDDSTISVTKKMDTQDSLFEKDVVVPTINTESGNIRRQHVSTPGSRLQMHGQEESHIPIGLMQRSSK